jgi:hypothetical protein
MASGRPPRPVPDDFDPTLSRHAALERWNCGVGTWKRWVTGVDATAERQRSQKLEMDDIIWTNQWMMRAWKL